jgi:hypothetical protein
MDEILSDDLSPRQHRRGRGIYSNSSDAAQNESREFPVRSEFDRLFSFECGKNLT